MQISKDDLKRLNAILKLGHELEKIWPASSPRELALNPLDNANKLNRLNELNELKLLIQSCSECESFSLSRLAFHAHSLDASMTAKHLMTILVPFERLSNRALRDDEIIVENDQLGPDFKDNIGPIKIIAENIRSAFNVGAIFRTAECFGAEEVILSGYSSSPEDEKTQRTSMGTDEHVPWRKTADSLTAMQALKEQGYKIIALETARDAQNLGAFCWPEKCAVLVGNERFGIEANLLEACDHIVRIPVFGRKNSLNVGIAMGIALADWRRKYEDHKISLAAIQQQTQQTRVHQHAIELKRTIEPIGFFHGLARFPYEARRQGVENKLDIAGSIELAPGRQFEQALRDLDGFERIWIIYDFNQNNHWHPMVLPPRGPHIKRGVFATRSPYRPNHIGMSAVKLCKVVGRKIYIEGFDLLDGTPIYDIKPYIPYCDSFPEARTGWLEGIDQSANQVRLEPQAAEQLLWLEQNGVHQLRGFIMAQLEYEPLDNQRKRVAISPDNIELIDPRDSNDSSDTNDSSVLGPVHCLAYRTWRVKFSFDLVRRLVTIIDLLSGYSKEDLIIIDSDPYADKALHRKFSEKYHGDHS
jgi:tRNA-Thr(GGU) m(6)t(6)A37 methyltransferase TsaA